MAWSSLHFHIVWLPCEYTVKFLISSPSLAVLRHINVRRNALSLFVARSLKPLEKFLWHSTGLIRTLLSRHWKIQTCECLPRETRKRKARHSLLITFLSQMSSRAETQTQQQQVFFTVPQKNNPQSSGKAGHRHLQWLSCWAGCCCFCCCLKANLSSICPFFSANRTFFVLTQL